MRIYHRQVEWHCVTFKMHNSSKPVWAPRCMATGTRNGKEPNCTIPQPRHAEHTWHTPSVCVCVCANTTQSTHFEPAHQQQSNVLVCPGDLLHGKVASLDIALHGQQRPPRRAVGCARPGLGIYAHAQPVPLRTLCYTAIEFMCVCVFAIAASLAMRVLRSEVEGVMHLTLYPSQRAAQYKRQKLRTSACKLLCTICVKLLAVCMCVFSFVYVWSGSSYTVRRNACNDVRRAPSSNPERIRGSRHLVPYHILSIAIIVDFRPNLYHFTLIKPIFVFRLVRVLK